MSAWSYHLNNPIVNPYIPPKKLERVLAKKAKTNSGKKQKGIDEKGKKEFGENGKTLTKMTPETPAWITAWDGSADALPAYTVGMIHAWAISWPGKPGGNPYSNTTNRADSEAMVKRGLRPADVARYCTYLHNHDKRWQVKRVPFTTMAGDIDSWLERNPAPASPAAPGNIRGDQSGGGNLPAQANLGHVFGTKE